MNELKQIIETIIPNEIEPDVAVFANGFILSPVVHSIGLKGNGKPEEIVTKYQLDFFLKNKGEMIKKSKLMLLALSDYPTSDFTFTWEETVRLWRATAQIETI